MSSREIEVLVEDRLEELVSHRFSGPFVCTGHTILAEDPDRQRIYSRYEFSRSGDLEGQSTDPRQSHSFFVKQGPKVVRPGLEEFLNEVQSPFFDTPFFWGCFSVGGRVRVGAWEYVSGRQPAFGRDFTDDLARVIRAVAAINAVEPGAVKQVQGLRAINPGVEPVAARMDAVATQLLCENQLEASRALEQIETFARQEGRLLARIEALGKPFLTHHDIKAANLVIRAEDSPIVVLDWTSARISAPGLGLRLLFHDAASLESTTRFYIQCMRQLGHTLALADVLFAIVASKVFRAFCIGIAQRDLGRIHEGFRLMNRFHTVLDCEPQRSPAGRGKALQNRLGSQSDSAGT